MLGISFKRKTSEERLLQRMRIGEKEAFEELYRQHVRYLTALCGRYIVDEEDVKDVLQEAFMKVFAAVDRFEYRGEGSLRGWMSKIVLNEALKFLRQNKIDTIEIVDDNIDLVEVECKTDDVPTEVIYQFIQELPPGYRTVFNLYVVEEKSHKEIAALLGIKENTSASQFYKAKAMLANKIKQYRTTNSI